VVEVLEERVRADLERAGSDGRLVLVAELGEVVAFAKVARFVHPAGVPPNAAPEGHYLTGVIVAPAWRRRGIARALTAARLAWIDARAAESFYFANARNEASIALHAGFGFVEASRDFWHPAARFDGGAGVLFRRERGHGSGLTATPSPG
jgi:predicted GNAT family acetyltransferase